MKLDAAVPGGPCWTELGTGDLDAARRFYGALLGWRTETDPRAEAGGYTMAYVGDSAVAALTPLYQPEQPVAWNVSFAVSDADVTARLAGEAGGKVLLGPMDVLDAGRFAVIADPGGAVFQLWQAHAFPGAGVFNAPGSLGWVELLTRDTARAERFYTTVFGWTVRPSAQYTQWGVGGEDFGGMFPMDGHYPPEAPAHWRPYFAVADIDAAAATASAEGGTVVMPPTRMPEAAPRKIAMLLDPQGAAFCVYQDLK